jgi:hypothetical protein
MLEDALGLIGVYVLAFVFNAVPGLMPPTWIVFSALVVKFDLPLLFAATGEHSLEGLDVVQSHVT